MAHSAQTSPRLSIGMPVYNAERYLAEALDGFLAQTFQDFEIIVSDNASSDRTAEICQSFAERDPRIRYFRNGSYLQTCVRILDDDPNVILAHSRTAFVDDHGQPFPVDPATGCYIDPRTGIAQTADSPMVADSPVAIVRFWQVLSGACWGTHMFGAMRRLFPAEIAQCWRSLRSLVVSGAPTRCFSRSASTRVRPAISAKRKC